jgi:tetratricopeptide (TPR) repeat protein
MGLLDFFRPSPEKRIARARRALDADDPALARDELLGLEGDEAASLRAEAHDRLVTMNLEAAVSWARAGDEERVRVHMGLAAEHHDTGRETDFRDTRRQIREIRQAQEAELEEKRRAEEARLMQIDPLHQTGDGALAPLGLDDEVAGPDAEEIRARLALVVENYPESLKGSVEELGGDFARAILDLEDGRPDLALQLLLHLPEEAALVRWERARAAHTLGDPKAAARELRAFANLAGGHHAIGQQHSGLLLARVLAESGDAHEALRVLRDLRTRAPNLGGFLFAQLLAATDQLPEADAVLRDLVKRHPLEPAFYLLLAHVRVQGGHRREAMRALEQGLHQNQCASGTCAARPPDPALKRLLATLYLEDGMETKRALQLLDEAPIEGAPSWDEAYALALAGRERGERRAEELVAHLHAQTPEGDPRSGRLQRYLPLPGEDGLSAGA